jgi:hypothetical protein
MSTLIILLKVKMKFKHVITNFENKCVSLNTLCSYANLVYILDLHLFGTFSGVNSYLFECKIVKKNHFPFR